MIILSKFSRPFTASTPLRLAHHVQYVCCKVLVSSPCSALALNPTVTPVVNPEVTCVVTPSFAPCNAPRHHLFSAPGGRLCSKPCGTPVMTFFGDLMWTLVELVGSCKLVVGTASSTPHTLSYMMPSLLSLLQAKLSPPILAINSRYSHLGPRSSFEATVPATI